MKKLIASSLAIVLSTSTLIAAPGPRRGCPSPRPAPHHCPPPSPHHSYHHKPHNDWWVGPTILGSAILGSTIATAASKPSTVVVEKPVVVSAPAPQPTVIIQNSNSPKQVWVEGRYEQQVQPNGVLVNVWVPGHLVPVAR